MASASERQGKAQTECTDSERLAGSKELFREKYTGDMRKEIIAMIYLALGERQYRGKRFELLNIPENITHFVQDYNKAKPAKAYGNIDALVLDDIVPGTDGLRHLTPRPRDCG